MLQRMKIPSLASLAGTVLLAATPLTLAEEEAMETDWLELVRGYKGSTMGAELVSIEEGDAPDMQEIMVALPKDEVGDPDDIEEVIVVGRMPDKPVPMEIEYEWVDDYEKDRYGLVIRLSKNSNWPIRLYFNSEPGFTR